MEALRKLNDDYFSLRPNTLLKGVILSVAVFQAERRISLAQDRCAGDPLSRW
jgi:hypothetical protein